MESVRVQAVGNLIYYWNVLNYIEIGATYQRSPSTKTTMTDHDEENYLNLVRQALASEEVRRGRGGPTTRSIFGHQARYSLKDSTLPLLTTKKVFTRGIIEELLWMIRGSTNVDELKEKNVHIWDGHSSREHLDNFGLTDLREGDIGPGYGYQFRHAGATYRGCDANCDGEGVDQLEQLVFNLKNNPSSRRHVVSAWSVPNIHEMALPPCHCLFQFYVGSNGLSCQLYQRSGDIGLGVPFNITSYSILTHIIAKLVGVPAYEFIHTIGDAHIYTDHEGALKEQITRKPFPFPTLKINRDIETLSDVEKMSAADFEIVDYQYHPKITMKMVV